jgi:hypothetical protein
MGIHRVIRTWLVTMTVKTAFTSKYYEHSEMQ